MKVEDLNQSSATIVYVDDDKDDDDRPQSFIEALDDQHPTEIFEDSVNNVIEPVADTPKFPDDDGHNSLVSFILSTSLSNICVIIVSYFILSQSHLNSDIHKQQTHANERS